MVLQAWEQFETAAAVYASARALERRFEWYYLGGLVETRLAHHAAAATLLREAVALSPDPPARLALADALFESGDVDASEPLYRAADERSRRRAARALRPGPRARRQGQQRGGAPRAGRRNQPVSGVRRSLVCRGNGAAWSAQARGGPRGAGPCPGARRALACRRRSAAGERVAPCETTPAPTCDARWALERRGDVAGAIRGARGSNGGQSGAACRRTSTSSHSTAGRAPGSRPRRTTAGRHASAPPCRRSALQLRCLPAAAAPGCRGRGRPFRQALAGNPEHAGALEQPRPAGRARRDAWMRPREPTATRWSSAPGDPTMRFNLGADADRHQAVHGGDRRSSRRSRRRTARTRPRYMFGAGDRVGAMPATSRRAGSTRARRVPWRPQQGQRDLVAAIDRELAKLAAVTSRCGGVPRRRALAPDPPWCAVAVVRAGVDSPHVR